MIAGTWLLGVAFALAGCNLVIVDNPNANSGATSSSSSTTGSGGGSTTSTTTGDTATTTGTTTSTTTTGGGGAGGNDTTSTTTGTGGQGAGGSDQGGGGQGGNPVQPLLSVELDTGTVSSGKLVKKDQEAKVVALKMTAAQIANVPNLTLTCQAKIAGSGCEFGQQCAREACASRVTSISVFDGAALIGQPKAPDLNTGKAFIGNVNALFAAGETKTFTVKASLSSVASAFAPYDQIAIGIEQPWEIIALDGNDNSILAEVQANVIGQTGANPTVVQTIHSSGTLTIVDMHPPSTIVVQKAWALFSQYGVMATYEDVTIDYTRLAQVTPGTQADNADFTEYAIYMNGVPKCVGFLPAFGATNGDCSVNKLFFPKDVPTLIQIWGHMAEVVPSMLVGGAWNGVARSGHHPALGFTDSVTDGEWDPFYSGKLNLRATGATSGERIYVDAGVKPGNRMALRKSKPIVTRLPLSSNTLVNADQDIFKFQVAADGAGSVTFKRINLGFAKTMGMQFGQCHLRRGAVELGPNEFTVELYAKNAQFPLVTVTSNDTEGNAMLQFQQEQLISGSGFVYTLHCTNNGVVDGQSLAINMAHSIEAIMTPQSLTGSIINNNPNGFALLDASQVTHFPTFLWSDMSEVPHWDVEAAQGGSWDVISDAFVDNLSGVTVLSS